MQMMNFNVFVERELAIKWAPCAVSSRGARGENDTDNDENELARFSRTGNCYLSIWDIGKKGQKKWMRVWLADNCFNNYLETIHYITRVERAPQHLELLMGRISGLVAVNTSTCMPTRKSFSMVAGECHVSWHPRNAIYLRMNRPEFVRFSISNLVFVACMKSASTTWALTRQLVTLLNVWTTAMSRWMRCEICRR